MSRSYFSQSRHCTTPRLKCSQLLPHTFSRLGGRLALLNLLVCLLTLLPPPYLPMQLPLSEMEQHICWKEAKCKFLISHFHNYHWQENPDTAVRVSVKETHRRESPCLRRRLCYEGQFSWKALAANRGCYRAESVSRLLHILLVSQLDTSG